MPAAIVPVRLGKLAAGSGGTCWGNFMNISSHALLLFAAGVPVVHGYETTEDWNILIMERLGPSLEDLFTYCRRQFSMKTVLMIADQMVRSACKNELLDDASENTSALGGLIRMLARDDCRAFKACHLAYITRPVSSLDLCSATLGSATLGSATLDMKCCPMYG
jgi:hypothetical protein